MEKGQHVQHLLLASLDGALPAAQRDELQGHLAACPDCESELSLLREARQVLPQAPSAEPRPGFARRVALQAVPGRGAWSTRTARWALAGSFAMAGLAALAFVATSSRRPQPSDDLRVAQRLELYEDMSVLQHQEALEDLDVVAQLHTLQPEARP